MRLSVTRHWVLMAICLLAACTPTPTNTALPGIPKPAPPATPTLGPIGEIQPIPGGLAYLGDKKTLALGFNMDAGGSIGSLLYNGRELVDRSDLGRYIQLSFYDGNDTYGDWNQPSYVYGWNPEQAGDKDAFGAKVLEYRSGDKTIYIKALGKEWGHSDEDSDVIFETWAWQRAGYFEVHLRGTHTGTDTHTKAEQEFPAAYFATSLTHEFGYFGDAPFTGQSIEEAHFVGGPVLCPPTTPTENWAAFGTADGIGLILAVPPQPYLKPQWAVCLLAHVTPAVGYISPIALFDVPLAAVREETIYLIPGPIDSGRAIVYDLMPHTSWTFDLGSAEGWSSSSVPAVNVTNGILTARLSPAGMLTSHPDLHIYGAVAPTVTLNAHSSDVAADVCLHFITASDPDWDASKAACVLVTPGAPQTYTFALGMNPSWKDGIVTRLGLDASKPISVEIDSLAVNANGYAWEFELDGDTEGWFAWNQMTSLQAGKGLLLTQSTGSDPYMGSPGIAADAKELSRIEIRMKVSAGNVAQLFFVTDSDSQTDETKSLPFAVAADGQFHTYTLDMSAVPSWNGTIQQIRFDPIDTQSIVEIDYIRLIGP